MFEFQVMPQLLAELGVDSEADVGDETVDWGVLAVFTCSVSCSVGTRYAEEWVYSNECAGDTAGSDDDDDDDDDDDEEEGVGCNECDVVTNEGDGESK